jgi:ATP-dependent DNA ligase
LRRSLGELQVEAEAAGINPHAGVDSKAMTREQIMDALRGDPDDMQVAPMKATDLRAEILWGTKHPFKNIRRFLDEDFALEPKLDGARMRMMIGVDGSRLSTGSSRSVRTHSFNDRSANFPHLAAIASEKFEGTLLDGELMAPCAEVPRKGGGFTNSPLNAAVAIVTSKPDWAQQVQDRVGPCAFFAFDVLVWKGKPCTHKPYEWRRARLEKILSKLGYMDYLKLVPSMEATPENILWCLAQGYEGSMLKKRDGVYQPGKRSKYWYKVKTLSTLDGFITGFDPGEGRNKGKVGGVKVSVFGGKKGKKEIEIGQFGAMTDELRDEITRDPNSFIMRVVEVAAQGRTTHGRLRHPQLVRFRDDKAAIACTIDQLDHFPEV